MIKYNQFKLANGLHVIHHYDDSTQLCVLNMLYNVGSKHENPNKTGFAHLFEHLMFGGSVNIEEFDTVLQDASGESNAFTSNDITNYYLTLPANNIETGFWLESDRMLSLDFNQESLDIQRNVVIEEFKERYLNQPYGDVWLKILPLAYKVHPYNWPTIGKEISHIENATLDDVKTFFKNFYCPNNAVLVLAGNLELETCKTLVDKWFAPIPSQNFVQPNYSQEPKQTAARNETVYADVPLDMIVKVYHMPARTDEDYFAADMLTDILGAGKSSRFYVDLVKNKNLFSELDAYISGDVEAGLLMIEGKLSKGVSMENAENAILNILEDFKKDGVGESELTKIKNKSETNIRFNDMTVLNKAMKLAYAWVLGDVELVNTEADSYLKVTEKDIKEIANKILVPTNCSTLYYLSKQNDTK
ncbi:MAG: insulinase family protein [Bacteroidia bacterium]|nr:insulinase family protein [Bacteroidia bacterium]